MSGINQTALEGIKTSSRRLQEAAHAIATAPAERAEPTDFAEPVVQMLEAQRAIEASATVLRRANDVLDNVLDGLR